MHRGKIRVDRFGLSFKPRFASTFESLTFEPQVLTAPLQVYNVDGVFREVADVLHWLTTSYWFLDVPASFLTAVYINDILHSRLADVARAYFKAWFWFLGETHLVSVKARFSLW